MTCGKPCNCPSYLAHLRSISVQPTTHPVELKERQWHKDNDAYLAMRRQGLQPKSVEGSAELQARATTQQEIEWGALFTKEQMPEVREGIRIAQEIQETGSSDGVAR